MGKGFCRMPQTKLHKELHKNLNDGALANRIYRMTQTPEFRQTFNDKLIYDNNGEPTYESVISLLNTGEIMNSKAVLETHEGNLNWNLPKSNTEVLRRVVEFNKQNNGFTAYVEDVNGTMSSVRVEKTDSVNSNKAKILEENLADFDRINNFMKTLGIEVKILDPVYFHGEDALTIASNVNPLRTGVFGAINIANNLAGIRAISEEFGHFVVECCRTNPVISRCEEFLNKNQDIIKEVLGNEYDSVNSYYTAKGRKDLVAREALGRILANEMNHKPIQKQKPTILGRAMNLLHGFMDKFKLRLPEQITSYESLVSQLTKTASEFINRGKINDETIRFLESSGDTLAHTQQSYEKNITSIMDNLRNRVEKYKAIYDDTNKEVVEKLDKIFNYGSELSAVQKAELEAVYFDYIKNPNKDHADMLMRILMYKRSMLSSNILLSDQLTKMNNMYNELKNMNFSMEGIIANSKTIMMMKNLILTYSDSVKDLLNEVTDAEYQNDFNEEEKALIEALKNDIMNLERTIINAENKINRISKELIIQFYNETFNPDGSGVITMKGTSLHKEHVISLTDVVDSVYGDISIVDRLMNTGYNSSDLLTQLVSTKIKQQQEKIRQQFNQEIHNLEYLKETYGDDASFIYEFDEEGKPTGYYINKYGIDFKKFDEEEKKYKKQVNAMAYLSDEEKEILKAKWRKNNTRKIVLNTYKQVGDQWVLAENKITVKIPKDDKRWHSDAYDNLNAQQQEFMDKLLEYKHKMDYINGLSGNFRPFKCVQRSVSSITERIVTGQGNAASVLKRGFTYTDEDVTEFGETINEHIMNRDKSFFTRLKELKNKILRNEDNEEAAKEVRMLSNFEGEIYRKVPLNYVNDLEDLSQLSLSTFDNLMHYTAATFQHEGMNEIADIMELTVALSDKRTLYNVDSNGNVIKSRVGEKLEPLKFNMKGTNISKQMREIINMQVYSEYKEKGSMLLNSDVSVSKLVDGVLRLTSISMLGWNPFTGLNNLIVGKSQMLINSFGSEYYSVNDWMKADTEYVNLLKDYLGEIGDPFKKSKMALIERTFNPHNDWMKELRNEVYSPKAWKTFQKVAGPSFMMEAGEHHMKMSTCLSVLYGYKMLDDKGNETNLYDSLEVVEVKNTSGEGTHTELKIKDGYTKLDGKEFILKSSKSNKRTDLQIITDRMTITNHRMHGIYDQQDYIIAKQYAVGRIFLLYRNFMFPFFSRRWKGINADKHGMPQYWNIQLNSEDEGYYVTTMKFLKQMFWPNIENIKDCGKLHERFNLIIEGLSDKEKENLNQMITETVTTLTTWTTLLFSFRDWDDDEGIWVTRAANYFLRRLNQEMTYAWNPGTLKDILQSPTPVMGPLKDITRMIKSVGDDHILQTGPYAGMTRREANIRRAVPIIPNIIDFINLDTEDKRFKVFEDSFLYKNSQEKDE